MNKPIIALCIMCVVLLCGCKEDENDMSNGLWQRIEGSSQPVDLNEESLHYEEMTFQNPETGVFVLSVNEAGEMCTLNEDGHIKMYAPSGTLKYSYPNCIDFTSFCCEGNNVYAYDSVKAEIIWMNLETGERKLIAESFAAEEVLRMEKLGEELYLLIIPEGYQEKDEGNDYVNYGECLFCVSLIDGSCEKVEIENVIAMYGGQNGRLYYYVYRNGKYALYEYNTITKVERVCYDDMKESYGITYLSAFVYEQDIFVYSGLIEPCIRAISLKDGTELVKSEEIMLYSGNDMDCIKGNVIFGGYPLDGTPGELRYFYINPIG